MVPPPTPRSIPGSPKARVLPSYICWTALSSGSDKTISSSALRCPVCTDGNRGTKPWHSDDQRGTQRHRHQTEAHPKGAGESRPLTEVNAYMPRDGYQGGVRATVKPPNEDIVGAFTLDRAIANQEGPWTSRGRESTPLFI